MLHSSGFSVGKIKARLSEENVDVTRRSLYRLIKKFQQTNQYKDLHRRKREKKITPEMAIVMNNQLEENDEATARQLRSTLMERYPALRVSLSTVKRQRSQLGWVATRPHYCQLIRELNKIKRLVWCKEQCRVQEDFSDVIFQTSAPSN